MPEPTKAAMRAALAIARMVGDALKESLESQGYVITEISWPLSNLLTAAGLIDREAELPELIESLQELVSAVGEYRYWFDTCTRTLAKDWKDLAAGASDRLDSAISAARKRGNNV